MLLTAETKGTFMIIALDDPILSKFRRAWIAPSLDLIFAKELQGFTY